MAVVAACDWVVDVGPGAGFEGGEVLYSGPLDGLGTVERSITAKYQHHPVHAVPSVRRTSRSAPPRAPFRSVSIERHTVHGLDVTLPLGVVTVLTGVSGSGKSTVLDVIHDAVGGALAEHHLAGDEPVSNTRQRSRPSGAR